MNFLSTYHALGLGLDCWPQSFGTDVIPLILQPGLWLQSSSHFELPWHWLTSWASRQSKLGASQLFETAPPSHTLSEGPFHGSSVVWATTRQLYLLDTSAAGQCGEAAETTGCVLANAIARQPPPLLDVQGQIDGEQWPVLCRCCSHIPRAKHDCSSCNCILAGFQLYWKSFLFLRSNRVGIH